MAFRNIKNNLKPIIIYYNRSHYYQLRTLMKSGAYISFTYTIKTEVENNCINFEIQTFNS